MRVVLQLHWHFLLCSEGSEVILGFKWCGKWGWGALMLQEWPSPSLPENQVLLSRWDFICTGEGNQWRSTSTAPRLCSLQMFPAWWDAHSAEHWHQPSAEWGSALTEGMAGRGEVALAPSSVVQSPISVPAHSGDRRGWSVNQWMALSSCLSCYRLLLLSLGTLVAVISYLEWKDFFLLLDMWEIWEC